MQLDIDSSEISLSILCCREMFLFCVVSESTKHVDCLVDMHRPLLGNEHTTKRAFTSSANCGNGDGDDYDDAMTIIVVPMLQA